MELKTGRKVLKRRGNVGILRLDNFFSKIYKSRILAYDFSCYFEIKVYNRNYTNEKEGENIGKRRESIWKY